MTTLRVGIIGCGRISDLHVLGYQGRRDARIVALCDSVRSAATGAARRWGLTDAAIFEDYRELCLSDAVDLVEIIVPHHMHYDIAAFATDCELHVSLQKPLSLDLGDADWLVRLAARSQHTFRLYENFFFYPPVMRAVELIEDGLIGEPLAVRLKSNAGYSPDAWEVPLSAQQWRHRPDECGGGPLVFDDGHHKFSLAWLILGQPAEVHAWIGATPTQPAGPRSSSASGSEAASALAQSSSGSGPSSEPGPSSSAEPFELDSPSLVSMRYPSGAIASLEVVYSRGLLIEGTRHYAQDDRMEITGTDGVIWVNRGHGRIGNQPPVASYADGRFEAHDCETGWEHSFIGSTRSLLDCLAAEREPILTPAQGRDVLAAALAAQQSAAAGSAVTVDEPAGRPPSRVRAELAAASRASAAAKRERG